MQMGVIDNNGNRLLDGNDQTGLQEANLQISFRQKLNVREYFFRG